MGGGIGMDTSTRVLVVDDEPEIVDVMRDFLEAEGFGVEIARNGREALAALARAPVDCLLLDVMMPGLSGFELARRIRETSDVPILFLSARDTPTDKIRGLIGGGAQRLRVIVRRGLQRGQQARELGEGKRGPEQGEDIPGAERQRTHQRVPSNR